MTRKSWAISLLFLLLCSASFAFTQATYTVTIKGNQGGACQTLENCIVSLGGTSSVWDYYTEWQQFSQGQSNPGLFCQYPVVAGGNPFIASCAGVSPFDGTRYSMTQTEKWRLLQNPCSKRWGCYYVVTGGQFSLTASDASLHALGIPGY